MAELILFTVSVLPVILIGFFIYKRDKNKEPIKILVELFVGGILSCFLVLLISFIMSLIFPIFRADAATLNLLELVIYVFIGVALVEEFCKWIFAYKIAYHSNHFDEMYDMIVYAAFVALGFACFENLGYVYQYGIGTGLVRAILAVPGHACDGVFMGYYLGLAKLSKYNNRNDLSKKYLVYSILVPTILHGIYDYCLFSGYLVLILLFFVFVIIMFIMAIRRIKRTAAIETKLKYQDSFCPNCGTKVDSDFCPMCGRKNN